MCYSAMVRQDLRKTEREFGATIDYGAFVDIYRQRDLDPSLKIPDGIENYFIEHGGAAGKAIQHSVNRFRLSERRRIESELAELQVEISALEESLQKKITKTAQTKLASKTRRFDKLQKEQRAPGREQGDYRIYPLYFAPVIVQSADQRSIVPMRYRILPRTGVEVPSQYNVFNARRDSLQVARNWKPLFGHKHAVFPFIRFFEWVQRGDRKIEISFTPEGFDGMWSASLYEEYRHPELGLIRSFAMVTDEPPVEVSEAGHDRCPVFLDKNLLSEWLQPAGKSLGELDQLLSHKQRTYYAHMEAA